MSELNHKRMFHRRKHNRIARDLNLFAALIDSPFDLGTAAADAPLLETFNLPGTGRLGISVDQVTEPGDITISIGGREYGIGGGVANKVFRLDVGIRGRGIIVTRGAAAVAGNVKLHVLNEWQRPFVIATGVFS